jgi:uncharacterized protein
MQLQRFGDRYQLRLESGDKLFASLLALAAREGISYAALSGLGAVRWIRVAYFNVETREYEIHELEEQLEVTSLVGNITLREGTPTLHAHATLGRRDLSVIGGHVLEAIARPTLEIWLSRERAEVQRLPDDESGLWLMDLPDRLRDG